MLNVAVAEIRLQHPGVVAPVSKRVATGVPEHVRVGLERQLGRITALSIIRAKPAVVNGVPHSEVNANGDFGSCSL